MSMDFPSPASEGQFYTPLNGPQYVYVNGAWRMAGAPTAVVTAETWNRIVNGAMQISQEFAKGTGQTGSTSYIADQWNVVFATTGSPVFNCLGPYDGTVSGDEEITGFIRLSSTVADASLSAGEVYRVLQPIEGIRIADFKWGSAYARPAALRFRARSAIVGTFAVNLKASDGSASFIKHCTFTAATTWQTFSIPVPACTIGTWPNSTVAALNVQFLIASGSTTYGVEGWQAANVNATGPITNWLSVATQYFDVTNVGLYCDPLATGIAPPWVMPDEAEELRACQRYYATGLYNIYSSNVVSGSAYYLTTPLPVQPRTTPTLSGIHSIVSGFPGVIGTLIYIPNGVRENRSSSVTVNAGYFAQTYTANARM